MKSILTYLLFSLFSLLLACNGAPASASGNDSAQEKETEASAGLTATSSSKESASFTSPDTPISPGYMRVFTDGIWHWEGVLNMKGEPPQQRGEGRWVNFSEDGLFSFGKYEKELRTGRWHYLESEAVLEMIYDDEPTRLSGFSCQFGGEETIVLIGQYRYQNSGVQMKWEKFTDFPKQ
jgi:hypothetical protein